ncbi:transposase [Arthrobacter sp. SD76]|uniref:transposase n=1 Tax=Arthrobacter sp. SD76 TaxID=3415007 RepID=UPI003C76650C
MAVRCAGRRDRPFAAFRKALRMWLPRAAVSADGFHLVKLGNDMLTEVRQRLTSKFTAAGDAPLTRFGRIGVCCCGPVTHFRTGQGKA